jgi:hypothetical protein
MGIGKISTKNYDYLIGDEFKFQGTVHAGGISYSGADIKVVVNIYNTQEWQLRSWQKKVGEQREELDASAASWEIEAKKSEQLKNNYKYGTQEYEYNKQAQWRAEDEAVSAAERRKELDQREQEEIAKVRGKPPTLVLAEAQTLSISSFRDKAPVRSLGSVYPKGYTRGPRQIGGSIVFTVFDRDVLYDFLEAHPSDFDGNRNTSAVLDQLPPVDIIVTFASELGSVSRMALYGVEFVSAGQIMSIEDIITENTVEYVARDFDPMSNVGTADLKKSVGQSIIWQSKSASDLLMEPSYDAVKGTVDPYERYKRRNTPFL